VLSDTGAFRLVPYNLAFRRRPPRSAINDGVILVGLKEGHSLPQTMFGKFAPITGRKRCQKDTFFYFQGRPTFVTQI